MSRAMAVRAGAPAMLASLFCAGAALAHHSGYMYQSTPVWISGTVIDAEPRNPHTWTTVEVTSAGTLRRWVVEGPGQSQLERMGIAADLPQAGDTVTFCAYPYREEYLAQFSSTDADGTPRQLIEGHVLVRPDGAMRFWDPHGLLSACMRSGDLDRQQWLDFLRSDSRVTAAWCQQQAFEAVRTDEALSALVEQIDTELDEPCR